jgi:D-aminopeptidase
MRSSAPMKAHDLGIRIGQLPRGRLDAITDVAGVRVGHVTLITGDGPLEVGIGPVRTGVTIIQPHEGDVGRDPVYAGCHRLNGNGELTGLEWVREGGMLTTPIGLTNTYAVGTVRDALIAAEVRHHGADEVFWALPVVGETWDGRLNDINGQHVRAEHALTALEAATADEVAQGNVGGGTGMVCHEFKGGIGTASRMVGTDAGGYTVGALVQANYGRRERLMIAGVPVGEELGTDVIPSPYDEPAAAGSGSIIVILATDAPLLPHQCERLAQRAGLGIARMGGAGEHTSGDLFLAFATGNRGMPAAEYADPGAPTFAVTALNDTYLSRLFWAAIEATEEAILNALLSAETMTGRDGITAHALPHDALVALMRRYGRG